MAHLEQIKRAHVLQAIEEYDRRGAVEFLDTYGYEPIRDYLLLHGERSYETEPIVSVAHDYATGTLLPPDPEDGPRDAAGLLRGLGFEVDGTGLPPLSYTTAAMVGHEHSRATWALAARELLLETAATYHGVVTAKELADFVQRRSLIRTKQLHQHWLGDVLNRIAADCAAQGEPLLSALCVDASGRVASGYAVAVEEHRRESVPDADEHAARERLECYRRFGAPLPPGGGEPGPLPRAAPRRERATAAAAASAGSGAARASRSPRATKPAKPTPVSKPLVTCPVHFTVMPPSGICDMCD